MRSERKKQIMTLSILLIAIFVISIGFAAFSATLKISSGMMVNPDESEFKVMFSSSENTLETNSIKASPENMGDDATIDNTLTPTISGLSVNFTSPGDSVSYIFYVRNEGEYEAFLNSISFRGKSCIPEEGTNESMVINACHSITTTVSVGSITTNETKTNITGESLIPDQSKQVTVTISYDPNGARANGPFTVEFGDISMYYNAVGGINEEVEEEILYTGLIYRNSTENLVIGDNISAISYETTPLNINTNNYLKHEVVNNEVTASYACITYTENGTRKDVCLRGYDPTYYASNQSILRSVESYFNTLPYGSGTGSCAFYGSYSACYSDSLDLYADSGGSVYAYDGSSYCYVYSDGSSICRK